MFDNTAIKEADHIVDTLSDNGSDIETPAVKIDDSEADSSPIKKKPTKTKPSANGSAKKPAPKRPRKKAVSESSSDDDFFKKVSRIFVW